MKTRISLRAGRPTAIIIQPVPFGSSRAHIPGMSDSTFLNSLIGKPVRVVCRDHVTAADSPLVLREVSQLGLVADDANNSHFFAWPEVVEVVATPQSVASDDAILACFTECGI